MKKAIVVGAGLAGSEAAWQIAKAGIPVTLYEMKPGRYSPAHKNENFAELVCSNSLRAEGLQNAVGVLKEEMRRLGGLIIEAADMTRVPAGGALAVDRESFSRYVTQKLAAQPLVTIKREEVAEIFPAALEDDGQTAVVIATGPLTDGRMLEEIVRCTDADSFYFYDAAAPIVTAESIDASASYRASRYGKGEADYLNCPLTKEEYEDFYQALIAAEKAPLHAFEREIYFDGCMPIEVMAARGHDTLLFGPLKPVGLENPLTNERPYAVVQLRQDNAAATLYNLVGFQTHLKWPEQKRVFSLIPALKNAEFVRYGVMHRNTFVNSPRHLLPTYQLRRYPAVFLAGQITGVEGYLESAASGLVAGINAVRRMKQLGPLVFPPETAHGALANYITTADPQHFQPMNISFGLMSDPSPEEEREILKAQGSRRHRLKKADRKEWKAKKALAALEKFCQEILDDKKEI